MSSRPLWSIVMSWILPTALLLVLGFALAFAACEWFAAGRRRHRDDPPSPG